jgi:hypothetical protein
MTCLFHLGWVFSVWFGHAHISVSWLHALHGDTHAVSGRVIGTHTHTNKHTLTHTNTHSNACTQTGTHTHTKKHIPTHALTSRKGVECGARLQGPSSVAPYRTKENIARGLRLSYLINHQASHPTAHAKHTWLETFASFWPSSVKS